MFAGAGLWKKISFIKNRSPMNHFNFAANTDCPPNQDQLFSTIFSISESPNLVKLSRHRNPINGILRNPFVQKFGIQLGATSSAGISWPPRSVPIFVELPLHYVRRFGRSGYPCTTTLSLYATGLILDSTKFISSVVCLHNACCVRLCYHLIDFTSKMIQI